MTFLIFIGGLAAGFFVTALLSGNAYEKGYQDGASANNQRTLFRIK
jgi:hypothetical protein